MVVVRGQEGMERAQSDHGLYIFSRDDIRIFVPVFVDDITLASKKGAKFDSLIEEPASCIVIKHWCGIV